MTVPLTGDGYLAGEYPDGITALEGQPVEADIRVAWRSQGQAEGDGTIVARTRSDQGGEWRVVGLNLDELFDVIGTLPGHEEQIVSAVAPVPISFACTEDELYPNGNYNGMEGVMTVVGGLPPYQFALIDEAPPGLSISFDRRIVAIEGVTDIPDGTYYVRAEVTSSNNVHLEFEIPIYIGFNRPEGFRLERAALFRPARLRHGGDGMWRPTWVKVKVNENEGGEGVFVKLTWTDVNGFGNGFRIYRSSAPIDGQNLPTPIAVLPPATGKPPQELTWSDGDVIEGETYYYRVSTFFGDDEEVTDELTVVASPAPTDIGEFFQGGYYIGNMAVDGETYAILMSPEDADTSLEWKTSRSTTAGTDSTTDGWANTLSMTASESLTLAHPAAAYCRAYAGAGYDDWYLPARNELTLAWTYRAQLAELNMSMNAGRVWTSTQYGSSYAWCRVFTSGSESRTNKDYSTRVRPVRRLKLGI